MNLIMSKEDSFQKALFSSLQNIIVALKNIANGVRHKWFYGWIFENWEKFVLKSLKLFVKLVVLYFSKMYLRKPNNNNIARLLAVSHEKCGFPIYVREHLMNALVVKKLPNFLAWYIFWSYQQINNYFRSCGYFYDTWIWHNFVGLLKSHNDIHIFTNHLYFLPLLIKVYSGC